MKTMTRRTVAASAVVALVLGACGSDSDEATVDTGAAVEDTESAVTYATDTEAEGEGTDVTETTGHADTETSEVADGTDGTGEDLDADADETAAADEATPAEVVESELAAQMEGDVEAVAALWADDAVAVQPDGTEIGFYDEVTFPIDDFDGDGVVTIMDDHLAMSAITPSFGKTIAVECTEVSDTVVLCTETTENAFSKAAGVDPLVLDLQLTVKDGLIVRQEFYGLRGDPTAFETATMSGFDDYGQWVAETAPDDHAVMFGETGITLTMEAVELHTQMLPTYVDKMTG